MSTETHVVLKIDSGNAAFSEHPHQEVQRLLRQVADRIGRDNSDSIFIPLKDVNGNTVGHFSLELEEVE